MERWQVSLQSFPLKKHESFYRICRKHDRRFTDEEHIRRLHKFATDYAIAESRDGAELPTLIVAQYPVKEACENVVAEIENLNGTAIVERASDES